MKGGAEEASDGLLRIDLAQWQRDRGGGEIHADVSPRQTPPGCWEGGGGGEEGSCGGVEDKALVLEQK